MSSNLYKCGWVTVQEKDTRVIDNNALLEQKLSAVLHAASIPDTEEILPGDDGFEDGLDAEKVDALFSSDEGVIKGSLQAERDALLEEIENARAELAAVKEQADGMIEDAKSQIGVMQMKGYEEAKSQGYQEGERLGRQEADAQINEYLAKKKQLEDEYEKKIEELEPEFIETLTGIYEHIFKVDLARYRDLVANLLVNAMQNIENTRNFLVHVSKEDYEGVMTSKDRIRAEAGGSSVSVEFVEDATLSRSQCLIETENGIYDCSLDTQLSELSRKLKLLSYERD
ncbi:MAG: FliH/SctL family protein [Suilimivivens sp.]